MKLLLDTHIFLWYINKDERLDNSKRDAIQDSSNEVYLSVVSIWEAIIKYQLGKLPLPETPDIYLPTQRERHQISSLTLDEASVAHLVKLPLLHRDPFDRMLVCQTIIHDFKLITIDDMIRSYPVSLFD